MQKDSISDLAKGCASCEAKKWSQRRLAEALDEIGVKLDPSAVTRIERGVRDVKLREAVAIASALEVALQELIRGKDPTVELFAHMSAAEERMTAGRAALAGMGFYYLMVAHSLDEHPELLEVLKSRDGKRYRGSKQYLHHLVTAIARESRPVISIAGDQGLAN